MAHEIEYQGIRLIKSVVTSYATSDPSDSVKQLWLQKRSDPPNPFYNQTRSGLFLEVYYGLPSGLWTPWGKYDIGGSGSGDWREVVAKLIDRLGATVHREVRYTEMGAFGPIYALSKVDDFALPEAIVRERSEYVEYGEAKAQWQALADKHGPI